MEDERGYREDRCTCHSGRECAACKQWRRQYKVRKPAQITVSLADRLHVAEEKLAAATLCNDRVRMKNYRAQVRMILGRMKKAAQMVQLASPLTVNE